MFVRNRFMWCMLPARAHAGAASPRASNSIHIPNPRVACAQRPAAAETDTLQSGVGCFADLKLRTEFDPDRHRQYQVSPRRPSASPPPRARRWVAHANVARCARCRRGPTL